MLRIFVSIALLFSTNVVFAAGGEHICKSGKLERKVTVVELETGKKAPCEVKYTKENGEEKILYSAKADESYCDLKAHEFMGKLKEWGWECPE